MKKDWIAAAAALDIQLPDPAMLAPLDSLDAAFAPLAGRLEMTDDVPFPTGEDEAR